MTKARVLATIERLKLNDHDCSKVREEYATAFFDGDIKLDICGDVRRFWLGR